MREKIITFYTLTKLIKLRVNLDNNQHMITTENIIIYCIRRLFNFPKKPIDKILKINHQKQTSENLKKQKTQQLKI